MRLLALLLTLVAVSALADCSSNNQPSSGGTTTNTTTNTETSRTNTPPAQTTNAPPDTTRDVPLAPAHGGNSSSSNGAPPVASTSPGNEQTGMDTAALDAKISKAEAKAQAKNAKPADKLAAAAAYMERANLFMNAGRPQLYKFALRDYRRTLRYQPDNAEAQQSAKTIVDIYNSMGRPVPELGNEP